MDWGRTAAQAIATGRLIAQLDPTGQSLRVGHDDHRLRKCAREECLAIFGLADSKNFIKLNELGDVEMANFAGDPDEGGFRKCRAAGFELDKLIWNRSRPFGSVDG